MKPPPLRTLLVDDSETFLAGASAWIRDRDDLHVVGTASDGAAAVAAVERLCPDLVLIDAVMPQVNGFEATRRIKALPRPPWVVMVTLQEGASFEGEARRAGADGAISKRRFVEALDPLLARLRER